MYIGMSLKGVVALLQSLIRIRTGRTDLAVYVCHIAAMLDALLRDGISFSAAISALHESE